MTEISPIKSTDMVVRVDSQGRGTPFWILTDGDDAVRNSGLVLAALRASDPIHANGSVRFHDHRDKASSPQAVGGRSVDLRGATSLSEVERRVAETFKAPSERNEYAGWGDEALEREIHRTVVGSNSEWPHHREHSLRAARVMRSEQSTRSTERAAHPALGAVQPESEPDAESPSMGM